MTFCPWKLIGIHRVIVPVCYRNQKICSLQLRHENEHDTILSKELSESKDLSHITPPFPESFNLAAYVNTSETLQRLLKLNVNLSKIDKKPKVAEKLLKLDFERDLKGHLIFLSNYVDSAELGIFITKNPSIFYENIEDLKVRVNYMLSKQFTNIQISRIITKNPYWLMFSSIRIDKRLGFFQEYFGFNGHELRTLTVKQPKIITYNLLHIKTNAFVIKEEMGFTDYEMKNMILKKPKLCLMDQKSLMRRFDYLHNVIKIPHKTIYNYPQLLLSRSFRVKQRHMFLEKLGRAQYDPTKENYVPVMALVEGSDVDFCTEYAKCNVGDFNTFLKTI